MLIDNCWQVSRASPRDTLLPLLSCCFYYFYELRNEQKLCTWHSYRCFPYFDSFHPCNNPIKILLFPSSYAQSSGAELVTCPRSQSWWTSESRFDSIFISACALSNYTALWLPVLLKLRINSSESKKHSNMSSISDLQCILCLLCYCRIDKLSSYVGEQWENLFCASVI